MTLNTISTTPIFMRSSDTGIGPRTIEINMNQPINLANAAFTSVKLVSASIPYAIQTVSNLNNKLYVNIGACNTTLTLPIGSYYDAYAYNRGILEALKAAGCTELYYTDNCGVERPKVFLTADTEIQRFKLCSTAATAGTVDLSVTNGIGQDLGFTSSTTFAGTAGTECHNGDELPLLGDFINGGIDILLDDDVVINSWSNNRGFSNIIGRMYITGQDQAGGQIFYPSHGQETIAIPLINSRYIKQLRVRFSSSTTGEDIIFMGGTSSAVITFVQQI